MPLHLGAGPLDITGADGGQNLLMLALESGEWQTASVSAKQLHLTENDVAEKYWQAMHWARQVNGN